MGVASCAVAPCCTWPCPFGRHNLHPRGKTFGTGERPCRDYVPTLSGTPKNATAALKLGFAPPTKWPYSLSVRAGITSPHFPAPQKTLLLHSSWVSRPQPNGLIPSSPFRKFFPLEALSQCDMSRVQAKATAGPRKRILTSEYAPERITKIRRRFPE